MHDTKNNEKFLNCITLIFMILIFRSNCLKLDKNLYNSPENNFMAHSSLDSVMLNNNDLSPEIINYSSKVKTQGQSSCNKTNCGEPFGKCVDSKTCECSEWYVDVPYLHHKNYCTYRIKSQAVAFVLELLFLSGVGHLYSSRTIVGLTKLIFSVIIVIVIHCLNSHIVSESDVAENRHKNTILKYFPYVLAIFFFSVQVLDLFLIARNYYLDGYGIQVKKFTFDFSK